MATVDTSVNELVINKLTQAQYDALTEKSPTELYFVTDAKDNNLPLDVIDFVEKFPQCTVEDLGKLVLYTGPTTESTQESVQLVLDGTIYNGHIFGCIEVNVMMSENESVAYYMWKDVYESIPTIGDNVTGKVLSNNGIYPEWVDMPEGDKLPDQTDNAGKFLTTDGTTASWSDKPLVNTATGTKSISVMTAIATGGGAIAIGNNSGDYSTGAQATKTGAIAIGGGSPQGIYCARALGEDCIAIGPRSTAGENSKFSAIAIGAQAKSTGNRSIAIGLYANVTGHRSVLIGSNENGYLYSITENDTMYFQNNNGQFKLLNSDGTIPTDRFATTPTDVGTYVPKLTIAEDGTATREWSTESSGTVVVATPPTDNGTYVLKATVVDGVVTTEWVLENN